jgi:hypothetical protein
VRFVFPGLADAALGEGTGVKIHKLSVKEIKAVRLPHPLSWLSWVQNVCFFIALWHDTTRASVSGAAGELCWRRLLIPRLLSLRSC